MVVDGIVSLQLQALSWEAQQAAADLSSASIVFIDTEFSFWGSPASYLGTLLDISAGANHLEASVLDP